MQTKSVLILHSEMPTAERSTKIFIRDETITIESIFAWFFIKNILL